MPTSAAGSWAGRSWHCCSLRSCSSGRGTTSTSATSSSQDARSLTTSSTRRVALQAHPFTRRSSACSTASAVRCSRTSRPWSWRSCARSCSSHCFDVMASVVPAWGSRPGRGQPLVPHRCDLNVGLRVRSGLRPTRRARASMTTDPCSPECLRRCPWDVASDPASSSLRILFAELFEGRPARRRVVIAGCHRGGRHPARVPPGVPGFRLVAQVRRERLLRRPARSSSSAAPW